MERKWPENRNVYRLDGSCSRNAARGQKWEGCLLNLPLALPWISQHDLEWYDDMKIEDYYVNHIMYNSHIVMLVQTQLHKLKKCHIQQPRMGGERRGWKQCTRWKRHTSGVEDDLGPHNYLFCISITLLHEYQSRALDGQPGWKLKIEGDLCSNDEGGKGENNCRCIVFEDQERERERRTTFWLLHQTNVSNLYRVSGDRHMQINFSSIACSV